MRLVLCHGACKITDHCPQLKQRAEIKLIYYTLSHQYG
jgi:hypothetical protein